MGHTECDYGSLACRGRRGLTCGPPHDRGARIGTQAQRAGRAAERDDGHEHERDGE
jgi:hypothetical protein